MLLDLDKRCRKLDLGAISPIKKDANGDYMVNDEVMLKCAHRSQATIGDHNKPGSGGEEVVHFLTGECYKDKTKTTIRCSRC